MSVQEKGPAELEHLLLAIVGSNVVLDAVKNGNTDLDECMRNQDEGERCRTIVSSVVVRAVSAVLLLLCQIPRTFMNPSASVNTLSSQNERLHLARGALAHTDPLCH